MGIIKADEISAYSIDGEIVCLDCSTDQEANDATEDEMITDDDIEKNDEVIYFCDRCKKRL